MNPEDIVEEKDRKRVEEEEKSFLFIQKGGLGDVVIASQACQDIKRFYRNSVIIFIVPKGLEQAAQGIKEIDEIYVYDKNDEHKGFWGLVKFLMSFKHKGKIDYSFTTFDTDNSLLLATVLGAKEKHTYRPIGFISNFANFLNFNIHVVGEETNTAEDLQNWVADIFKEFPYSKNLDFKYPKDSEISVLKKLTAHKAVNYPLIAVCPCSREENKNWTPKDAAELIECSYNDGRRVIFSGTNNDKWFVNEVKKLTKKPFFDIMGETDIFEIAALANKVQVFVAVESGSMHVAYASGASTVCLFFSSKDFYKWAPKEYKNTAILHRPEGISGEKCYEIIKDFLKQQASEEQN